MDAAPKTASIDAVERPSVFAPLVGTMRGMKVFTVGVVRAREPPVLIAIDY